MFIFPNHAQEKNISRGTFERTNSQLEFFYTSCIEKRIDTISLILNKQIPSILHIIYHAGYLVFYSIDY